ncbi:MAG TPA: hypothetical protein VF011_14335 [Terriglobales bacterium]
MSAHLRTRLLALPVLLWFALLVGCGGGSVTGQGPGLGNSSNNALLQGQYAFALSGQDINGPFFVVGSFTADGQGHLGGNEDVNSKSTPTNGTAAHFGGTYSVGPDGRGNAVIGIQPGCPNWQFTMISHAHALLTCLNTNITGSGTIDLQDPTAFSNSALKGNYVFGFSGVGSSGGLAVMAGDWSMDGAGTIKNGQTDVNDFGGISLGVPLNGTYSVASTGRGTATFSSSYATQNFVFYVVNKNDFKFLEIDHAPAPLVAGEVLNQAPSPFTLASFNGTYAFTLGGIDINNNPFALGGLLPSDGNGNIASGILDANDGGTVSLGNALAGPYTMSATGRGAATLSSSAISFPLAFYPAANGTVELVNTGGNLVVSGMAKVQTGSPFNTHSFSGNYAVNFSGSNLGSGGEEDISGQLSGDGAGNLSGVLDINNSGSIFQGVPLSSSAYTMSANGRGTASLNTLSGTFAMQSYQTDPNTVLFLDIDGNRVVVGLGQKQTF